MLELEIDGQPYQLTVLRHDFQLATSAGRQERRGCSAPSEYCRMSDSPSLRAVEYGVFFGSWGCRTARTERQNSRVEEYEWGRRAAGSRSLPLRCNWKSSDFREDQDVFNPKFWEGLRCPRLAVQ